MKKIGSLKHDNENRAYIPSKEEAGYEDANEIVKQKLHCTKDVTPR